MLLSMRPIRSVSYCKISGAAFSFISAPFSCSASLRPDVLAGLVCRKSTSAVSWVSMAPARVLRRAELWLGRHRGCWCVKGKWKSGIAWEAKAGHSGKQASFQMSLLGVPRADAAGAARQCHCRILAPTGSPGAQGVDSYSLTR